MHARASSGIVENTPSGVLAVLGRGVPAAPELHAVLPVMPISTEEIHSALSRVLRSDIFVRAPRMSQLLRFLVIRIAGRAGSAVSASAIAAEVFGRDADSFDPSIDPIVRVQLGRLRDKLNRYYASVDCDAALRFDIPIGTCVPSVTWRAPKQSSNHDLAPLHFVAVKLIGGINGRRFCRGFNEQLLYELYRVCGARITVHAATGQPLQRRLEGSLRIEGSDLRVSMRLIDNNSGRVLWAHQLDCPSEHSIRQQEQIAREICAALLPQL
jgi:TolB-like protein